MTHSQRRRQRGRFRLQVPVPVPVRGSRVSGGRVLGARDSPTNTPRQGWDGERTTQ